MVLPTNPDILNSIYEAKQEGMSTWQNTEDPIFPFLASRDGYMAHVKAVYPESPYILNVDFEVTARDLYDEYDANEVAADEKFRGRKIAVTGIINSIGKDFMDDPFISFETDYFQSVTCYFSAQSVNVISQLSKGDKITIVGTCQGMSIATVGIQDCQLW